MARLNVKPAFTHEGAPATPAPSAEAQLRRYVLSCLLWEDQFYVDGKTIAEQISTAAEKVTPQILARLAIEARTQQSLRHVPLLLLEVLSRKDPKLLAETMPDVVLRADEMAESLAVILQQQKTRGQNKRKIPHGWIKGIRKTLPDFNEYELAKYDRNNAIKLRDVLRIARPKPADKKQAKLWKRVVKRELETPDTWEVELSAGKDKKATFERLIREGKLGYLALLRNLRNMTEAGCDEKLVADAIVARKGAKFVLPFRYVAAARAAPRFEPYIDQALCEAISELPVLEGKTVVLIDVSGSMDTALSRKSDMKRIDAAAALGAIVHAERLQVITFSDRAVEVPPRRGMAGVDAIVKSQPHSGTRLGEAVALVNQTPHDRLIVISDEQSHSAVPQPRAPRAYMINVASYQNGVSHTDGWVHIDGFSESVLRFIHAAEREGIYQG